MRAEHWLCVRAWMEPRGFEGASAVAANSSSRALAYAAALGLADRAADELPIVPEDDRLAWSNATGEWHVVRVRYPFRPGYGRHPALMLRPRRRRRRRPHRPAAVPARRRPRRALISVLDDFPDQVDLIQDIALVLAAIVIAPMLWMAWLVIAGAFDLFSTVERQGVVVRARRPQRVVPFPRLLRPLARRDRFALFIAVDDGRSDRVNAWLSNERTAVPQGARARVKATPVLGYVRRSEPIGTTRPDADDAPPAGHQRRRHRLGRPARAGPGHACRTATSWSPRPTASTPGVGAALGALHLLQPEVRRAHVDGIDEAWTVNGPPGLCVMFARLGVFGPIDLVVAGINPGANVGRAIYHSGTVGAALTARNGGISGVAVSQAVAGFGVEGQGWDEMIADQRWDTAARVGAEVVAAVLADRRTSRSSSTSTCRTSPLDEIAGWRHAAVGDAAAADRRQRPAAPDRGPRRRLRRADGVGRRRSSSRRDRQRRHRARRGHGHLPQPAWSPSRGPTWAGRRTGLDRLLGAAPTLRA